MARLSLSARIGLVTSPFRRGIQRVRNMVRRLRRNVIAPLGNAFKSMGRTVRRGMALVAIGIGLATKEANDFRRQMALVNTLVRTSDIEQLTKQVRELAGETGIATEVLAKGLYQTLSAGIPENNAITFLAEASKAAVAGATDVSTAVEAVTRVIDSYNMSAADAAKISDLMFTTVRKGVITFEELAQNIGSVSGISSEAGVELEDLFSVIATASKTVKADKLFTGLRSAIMAILKPSDDLKRGLDEMGTTGEELLKSQGLAGALQTIRDMAGGSNAAFVKLIPNLRAIPAVLAVTGRNADKVAVNLKVMQNSAGETEKAFQKMNQPRFWIRVWRTLIGLVQQFGGAIDQAVGPAIDRVRDKLAEIADSPGFQQFIQDVEKAVQNAVSILDSLLSGGEARLLATEGLKNTVVGAFRIAGEEFVNLLLHGAVEFGRIIKASFTGGGDRALRQAQQNLGLNSDSVNQFVQGVTQLRDAIDVMQGVRDADSLSSAIKELDSAIEQQDAADLQAAVAELESDLGALPKDLADGLALAFAKEADDAKRRAAEAARPEDFEARMDELNFKEAMDILNKEPAEKFHSLRRIGANLINPFDIKRQVNPQKQMVKKQETTNTLLREQITATKKIQTGRF